MSSILDMVAYNENCPQTPPKPHLQLRLKLLGENLSATGMNDKNIIDSQVYLQSRHQSQTAASLGCQD